MTILYLSLFIILGVILLSGSSLHLQIGKSSFKFWIGEKPKSW
jgi:hypothetical protein